MQFNEKGLEYRRDISVLNIGTNFKVLNNMVLVKTYNYNNITKAGIHIAPSFLKEIPDHAIRCSIVVRVPDKLMYRDNSPITMYPGKPIPMDWETEMELQEGDIVFHDYLDSMNAQLIKYEGDEYRLIPYSGCYVAKRLMRGFSYDGAKEKSHIIIEGENVYKVIPLNGYVLCEEVEYEIKAISYTKKVTDPRKGKVKFIGKPNKKYFHKNRTDENREIKKDDVIFLFKQYSGRKIYLEDPVHRLFNGNRTYFVVQRFKIGGVE
jgi:co-chaperonin GroES (HSP10)